MTILISSVLLSTRVTALFAASNIVILVLLTVFMPVVSLADLAVPIVFNGVVSVLILVFSRHRNLLEQDRLLEILHVNEQLQTELQQRKRAEDQMAYSATHDVLTNLPNRVLLMDRLNHAMERAKRHPNFKFALLFLDLDRFKVVNDSLGHKAGDQLLVETASRLTTCVRSQDTVARLGGDEFVVLLEDIHDGMVVTHIADRIQHDLALPHSLDGYKAYVLVSIGIVIDTGSYARAEDMLRDADIAMYRAKERGRNRYEIFDPAMLMHAMTRLEEENDLRKAVERQEFLIHYQPILNAGNRRIIGFEALVRWQHPTRGLLQPMEFITIAEETGFIVPIGYWVLEEACRQMRAWQHQFPAEPSLTISVNWSTRQCAETDMAQRIGEILEKTSLEAHTLNLELTESLIVEDAEFTATKLAELSALGIQMQLDDFGTGYSSLGYLHTLPINTLKIDRTFIKRLESNGSGSEIVQMILTLAHDLGMKVVAEGVETDSQLSRLKAMECEYVQGFLFKKPMDSQAAGDLLGASFNEIVRVS